ncbi:MAG: 1,4-dihydroxy-2-naphthoate octaprenyltransferase [Wenzhouxiangellaceae bacterium]|nr:1,4-dihydroxy-2-naphthoate octaprenyltransferase [Wenzhouxiangellaceae bacterium]
MPLSLSPVVAGAVVGALESGSFRPDIALAAGLSAAAIQIGTNLHNDAVDAINGTDRADRVGPVRVTQRGWVEPRRMLGVARAAFALAALFGVYLVILGGWPIVAIGLVSIAAAWGYSSGPWPISRGPFGELFVLVFFGLVAVATVAWLHTGSVTSPAILVGAVVGLPATLVLLINNARDIEGDVRAGRKTLAILLGRRGSIRLAGVFMAAIVFSLLLLAGLGRPWYGALAGLIGLAPAIPIRRMLTERSGPEAYNASLRQAVRFQMVLTLAVCTGLVLAAWVG